MRSNCLFFVLALWLRRARKWDFGRIKYRRSRSTTWWCPHFLYEHRKRRLIHFQPLDPRVVRVPPPIFLGYIKYGDDFSFRNRHRNLSVP